MKHFKLLALAALSLCLVAISSCEKAFYPLSVEKLVGTKWEGYVTLDGNKQYILWTFTGNTTVEYENHSEPGKDATKDSPLRFKVKGTFTYNNLLDTFNATFDDDCGYTMLDFPYTAEGHFFPNSLTFVLKTKSGLKTDDILLKLIR